MAGELTALEEAFLESIPPEAREQARQTLIQKKAQNQSDEPMVWTYSNPFADIWSPNKKVGGFGYSQIPFSQAEANFHNLDRDTELKRFQELAFQAGLYGPNAEREDVRWGAYDDQTFSIWSDLNKSAAIALKAGKQHTVWDKLQDLVDHRPENAGKKPKTRAPLVTQLPDPVEIEEMIRGVAPQVIGRDADDAFISDFQAMYSRIVSEFQANKYALENTEEGGTITAPPSAEALAAHRLRTENPDAYEESRAAARHKAYSAMLKGLV